MNPNADLNALMLEKKISDDPDAVEELIKAALQVNTYTLKMALSMYDIDPVKQENDIV